MCQPGVHGEHSPKLNLCLPARADPCITTWRSLGAAGVMVPLINSAADAEQAVSYCLYPPAGQRSVAGDIGWVSEQPPGATA